MALASPASPFIWGSSGRQLTPDQVAREREFAAAMKKGGADYSPVGHWLQGAARAAQGLAGGLKDRWADEAEQAGLASARETYGPEIARLLGIETSAPDPVAEALASSMNSEQSAPALDAANALGGAGAPADFMSSLIQSESGGNWNVMNREVGSGGARGHYGRLQFGHARLQDAMNAGVLPRGTTPEQFMASPELQQAVEAWHFADIDQQAERRGLNAYLGQTVGGATITPEAIRAMAHLGGIGGAQRFLESGGQYNPSDAYGTSLLDYAQRHGGAGGDAVAQALASSSIPAAQAGNSGLPSGSPFGPQFPAADQAFGIGGAATGAVNTVFDAIGVGAPYPDVQQTQADFGVLRESLLNDIASAYNRQPPSWLLQEIRDLTPAAGSPFEGAGAAQTKLNAIGRHLTNELQITEQALQRQLSPQNRQELEARAQGLQAGIARVQAAINAFGQQRPQSYPGETGADGWTTLPNGVRIREVQ